MSYPPMPRAIPRMPSAPAPRGMQLVETTTFSDERRTYVTRDVLVPIKRHSHLVPCAYCSRPGTYGSQCVSCGAFHAL